MKVNFASQNLNLSQYVKGAGAGAIAKGIDLVAAYFGLWLLTHILDKAHYGAYVFALSIFAFSDVLTGMGIEKTVLYKLSGESRRTAALSNGRTVSFALVLTVGIKFIVGMLIILFLFFFPLTSDDNVYYWILILSLALPFKGIPSIFNVWYQSHNRIPESLLVPRISVLIRVLLLSAVFLYFPDKRGVGIVIILTAILSALIWMAWTPSHFFIKKPHPFSFGEFKYGFKIMSSTLVYSGIQNIDLLMLGTLASRTAVAEYAVAARLANTLTFGNQLLAPVFTPRIRKLIVTRKADILSKEYDQNRFFALLYTLAGAVIFLFFGRDILLLFGDFGSGYSCLMILSAAKIAQVGFGFNGRYLSMAGYANLAFFTTLLSLLLLIIFNLIFIPYWGASGAAAGTFSGFLIINSVMGWIIWKKDRFQTLDVGTLFVILSSCLMMLSAVFSYDDKGILVIGLGLALFLMVFAQKDYIGSVKRIIAGSSGRNVGISR